MQFEVNDVINAINGILFSEYVVYALLINWISSSLSGVVLDNTEH